MHIYLLTPYLLIPLTIVCYFVIIDKGVLHTEGMWSAHCRFDYLDLQAPSTFVFIFQNFYTDCQGRVSVEAKIDWEPDRRRLV